MFRFSNLKFTEKNRNIGTVGALTDYLKSYIQIFVEILFLYLFFFSYLNTVLI